MRGPLILLVDDYSDAREMYCEYLQFRGFRVVSAASGIEALQVAGAAERPSLILMDIEMPGMNGTDAMRRLRANPAFAAVPIVALTAHAFQREITQALADGFDAVIPKPCLPDQLVTSIAPYLPANARSGGAPGRPRGRAHRVLNHPSRAASPLHRATARADIRQESAWLFVSGERSARIVRRLLADGTRQLVIEGPLDAEEDHAFNDMVACVSEQMRVERRLVAQGFVWALTADRRKVPERRFVSRTDRRRNHDDC